MLKRPPRLSLDRIQGCQPPACRLAKSARSQATSADEESVASFYSSYGEIFTDEILEATGENAKSEQHNKARSKDPEFKLVDAFGSSGGRPVAGTDAKLWRKIQSQLEQCLVGMWLGDRPALSKTIQDLRAFKPLVKPCLLYTSPSPRHRQKSRMPSSA